MNLYQINAEIEQLENAAEDGLLIDEETGELMTLEQALDQLHMMKTEKVENIALFIRNLDAESVALKAEEERFAKRRKAAEAKSERLRAYLLSALTKEDGTTEKVKTTRVNVSVRLSGPSVVFTDETLLPMEFKIQKIEVKPDKASIKEVLMRGIEVPGAKLERGRSVIIK